jgi:hypothetical protein
VNTAETQTPDPNKALNAAGLPDAFSMDDLKAFLDEGEIAALTNGDESVLADIELAEDEPPAAAPQQAQEPQPQAQAPQVQLPDVAAAQAAIEDANAKLAALTEKYDDGELTRAEWQTQQAALIQQQASALAKIELAQTLMNQQQESRAQTWFTKLEAYHAAHPELASDAHIDGWDAALRSVTGAPAYANLPMEKQMELAHRLYADHVEVTTGQSLSRPASAKPAAKQAPTGPRDDPRPEAPRTLTGMSGLESAPVDDGTFAAIDRMMDKDPDRAEQMVRALPEHLQAAYLG